jgi:hypothetical protein
MVSSAPRALFRAAWMLAFLTLTGCLSPIAMHRAVLEYDRTVSYVEADLLLLNIARARHHRPVHFTAVSSVAATFDFRVNAGVTGSFGRAVNPDQRPVTLEYSNSVAENPTITIVPINGEEFTKRVLRPLDEAKFEFLVHQGFDINMVLRLLARGINVDGDAGAAVLFNTPSQPGYAEFRRRLLHLAALDFERKLYVGPIMFEDIVPVQLDRAPTPAEVVDGLEKGYRWAADADAKAYRLHRQASGRIVITNYNPGRLPNEERRRLQEEAQRFPPDYILVDIRPGFPGGDYPLHGTIMLRSLNAIIGFVARSIAEEPEYRVDRDQRTKADVRNPVRTLEIEESESKPADQEFSVEFEGRYYSIRKFPVSEGMSPSWNQEAFAVLSNLFQMTVTDVSNVKTPIISIPKG